MIYKYEHLMFVILSCKMNVFNPPKLPQGQIYNIGPTQVDSGELSIILMDEGIDGCSVRKNFVEEEPAPAVDC